jgi:aryl-alcohol dehydrogenase-like predicted oxidoreductase
MTTGRIGLGCATFGREITEAESFAVMDHALKLGIRLFDTAEAYSAGLSEQIVGRWMQSRGTRQEIVVVTKVTRNFTREHVRAALLASLERLQTGAVDLYLCHSFDLATPVEETCEAMNEAVRGGFACAIGCSNYTGAQLEEALAISESRGLAGFQVVENAYNLVSRDIERDLLPITKRRRIHVLGYSPLAAGFLMGKYSPDRSRIPKGTRFDVVPGHADVYFSERNFQTVERLQELAARVALPVERLALAWVLQNPAIDTVLVGARSTVHLDNAVQALATEFPRDQWE